MSAPSESSNADGVVEEGRAAAAGHPLVRYVLRRIGVSVLLVVGVTLVTFVLTNLVPGDTVAANLGQQAAADPTIVAAYRAHYGLDKPLPVQYLTYLGNLVHGDLGESQQTHRSVVADLSAAVPATLEIAIGAIAASILIGVGFGVVAAVRRGHLADSALRLVSVVGISVPTFWLAMVAFYVFSYQLDIAPGSGRLSPAATAPPTVTGLYTVDSLLAGQWATFADAVAHLMLPTLVLTLYTVGLLTRFTRSAVLEVLDQDYVRSARAKGLPGGTVLLRYVLRARARADPDGGGSRVRRAALGHRAGGADLLLARYGFLRLSSGVPSRPAGGDGSGSGRRRHLRGDQPDRRPALRRDRPASEGRMSAADACRPAEAR